MERYSMAAAKRAVEMTRWWKAWKSKSSFSTLPTAAWKSRKGGEISTFPQPGFAAMEKWKTKSRFPTFPRPLRNDDYSLLSENPKTKKGSRRLSGLLTLTFQDHSVLETDADFRIILRLENAR
jgi:hypothetical protein